MNISNDKLAELQTRKPGNFKRKTDSPIIVTQTNATIKSKLIICNGIASVECGERDKTVNHIISECSKLAQKEFKTIQDLVG